MTEPVLKIQGAVVEYGGGKAPFRAVDHVDLEVMPGEAVALVGESGCGKTSLARAVLGLEPLAEGSISWSSSAASAPILAAKVGMVWQDPFASLDPLWTIRKSLLEPARIARREVDLGALLAEIGLNDSHLDRYPHELSGGQRQRAAIGRALVLRPPLVICDEPTAALDLSIQAQILNLLKDLQAANTSSYLYISHDLETVRFVADRVMVMKAGKIVESGPTADVLDRPQHPYTQRLLSSVLTLDALGHLPAPQAEED
jgi:peptide/nickel transport system ATP-binding protein